MKEAGALTGMRIMVFIYSVFGRAAFNVVLVPVMAYFFIRRGSARRASMDFLRKVKRSYPENLQNLPLVWLSFRHFLTFGQSLLDKYIVWSQKTTDISINPVERKMLFDHLESGEGCLLISVLWELIVATIKIIR